MGNKHENNSKQNKYRCSSVLGLAFRLLLCSSASVYFNYIFHLFLVMIVIQLKWFTHSVSHSVSLSVRQFLFSTYLACFVLFCLFVCLFVCLCVCLFVCLFEVWDLVCEGKDCWFCFSFVLVWVFVLGECFSGALFQFPYFRFQSTFFWLHIMVFLTVSASATTIITATVARLDSVVIVVPLKR